MELKDLVVDIETLKTRTERLEAQYHYAVDLAEKLQKRVRKVENDMGNLK
ncbi:MAG: hypothetical protein AABY22_17825 [Nanoarchaeota archaeon]